MNDVLHALLFEKELLATAMQHKAFAAFYTANRSKLGQIEWIIGDIPNPNAAALARIGIDFDTGRILSLAIRLRHEPTQVDACQVAHEMEHLLLAQEGFPAIHAPTGGATLRLAPAINSLLQDPIVDRRLAFDYGFMQEVIAGARNDVQERPIPLQPNHGDDNWIAWTVQYVLHCLECELVNDVALETGFKNWFKSACPIVSKEGEALLSELKSRPFHTPRRMQDTFLWLLKRYKLTQRLVVSPLPQ